jgi:hypothetical protein
MGRKHQEVFLTQVLQPQQNRRLHQIILQQQGGRALTNKETADELRLTEDQRKQADAILAKRTPGRGRGFRGPPGPVARKQFEEARAALNEELLGLLTPDQQAHWKELIGEPFTGEIEFRPLGGRFGGPGGRGRPPADGVPPDKAKE